jgi:hypothetical protein
MEKLKSLADDILTFSKWFFAMFSLRLLPFGNETFKQILTLPGCGTAKIELAGKFAVGGERNGPATKPLLIQDAIASVTSGPWFKAALEFFTQHAFKLFLRNVGAP